MKKKIPLSIAENWKKNYKQMYYLQNEHINLVQLTTILSIEVREESCEQDAQEGT